MNINDLIEYPPPHCDTCGKEMDHDFCCDDDCVECFSDFLRKNPDEIPFLISSLKNDKDSAPWQKALDLLGDDLEILTLIGQCECGNRSINQDTIGSLLRLAYSMGNFQGTQSTIAALTKRKAA